MWIKIDRLIKMTFKEFEQTGVRITLQNINMSTTSVNSTSAANTYI